MRIRSFPAVLNLISSLSASGEFSTWMEVSLSSSSRALLSSGTQVVRLENSYTSVSVLKRIYPA